MRVLAIQLLFAALPLGLVSSCENKSGTATPGAGAPVVNPPEVEFGGRRYVVHRHEDRGSHSFELVASDDKVLLPVVPGDTRHLAPCPKPVLFVHAIDSDRVLDVAMYSCGQIFIYSGQNLPLSEVKPIEGKYKERHWVRPDPAVYIGLRDLESAIHRFDSDS